MLLGDFAAGARRGVALSHLTPPTFTSALLFAKGALVSLVGLPLPPSGSLWFGQGCPWALHSFGDGVNPGLVLDELSLGPYPQTVTREPSPRTDPGTLETYTVLSVCSLLDE